MKTSAYRLLAYAFGAAALILAAVAGYYKLKGDTGSVVFYMVMAVLFALFWSMLWFRVLPGALKSYVALDGGRLTYANGSDTKSVDLSGVYQVCFRSIKVYRGRMPYTSFEAMDGTRLLMLQRGYWEREADLYARLFEELRQRNTLIDAETLKYFKKLGTDVAGYPAVQL